MLKYSEYKNRLNKCNKTFYNQMEKIFLNEKNRDKNNNRIYLECDIKTAYQVPDTITKVLEKNGYSIVDHVLGICKLNNKKAEIKIGRVLKKIGREDLINNYSSDRSIHLLESDTQIVISRHPYDLIGMSTRRNWTTCHDLFDMKYSGAYLYQMDSFLSSGCLVAYLISKTDKNINNPLSRLKINNTSCVYTYLISKTKPLENGINILFADQTHYGLISYDFHDKVLKWIENANKFIIENNIKF
jgi:hypothetical protein